MASWSNSTKMSEAEAESGEVKTRLYAIAFDARGQSFDFSTSASICAMSAFSLESSPSPPPWPLRSATRPPRLGDRRRLRPMLPKSVLSPAQRAASPLPAPRRSPRAAIPSASTSTPLEGGRGGGRRTRGAGKALHVSTSARGAPAKPSPTPLRSSRRPGCVRRESRILGDSVRDDLAEEFEVELERLLRINLRRRQSRARCGDAHGAAAVPSSSSPRAALSAASRSRRPTAPANPAELDRLVQALARAIPSPPSLPASSTRRWRRRCSPVSAATAFAAVADEPRRRARRWRPPSTFGERGGQWSSGGCSTERRVVPSLNNHRISLANTRVHKGGQWPP